MKERSYNHFDDLKNSVGQIAILKLTFESHYLGKDVTKSQKVVGRIEDCVERKIITGEDGYYLKFRSLLFLNETKNADERFEEVEKENGLENPEYVRDAVYSGIRTENITKLLLKDRNSTG
ncbi:MAG: hypothetical protein V1944_02100 [Candidatus Aenigmatarchaeota archaeon]